MTRYGTICVIALSGILAACSGSQFNKGATSTAQSEDAAATIDGVTPEPIDSTDSVANEPGAPATPNAPASTPLVKDEDKTALDECLKQWTTNPFSAEEKARPHVIEINQGVNNNAVIFTDSKITAKPTLYLVNFNISVGNNGELEFLNPKGWYCFNVKAKVINNFLIKTACDTHVAIVSKQAQNDKNFTIQPVGACP